MDTAITNADKNIATILKNLGYENPSNQVATYIWTHPWAAIMAVALIFAVGAGLSWAAEKAWYYFGRAEQKDIVDHNQPSSPICVDAGLYIYSERVNDENGENIEGLYSLAFCLWVTNAITDGQTLKGLTARLHMSFPSNGTAALPIYGCANGMTDLRNGEVAKIEVGRVLYRPTDVNMKGVWPGQDWFSMVDKKYAEHILQGSGSHLGLEIRDYGGKILTNIGQFFEEACYNGIFVVLSADSVVAKTIRIEVNLFAIEPKDFLAFLPLDNHE